MHTGRKRLRAVLEGHGTAIANAAADGLSDAGQAVGEALGRCSDITQWERAKAQIERALGELTTGPAHPRERWSVPARALPDRAALDARTWEALGGVPAWVARGVFEALDARAMTHERGRWRSALARAERAPGVHGEARERALERALTHWAWPACTPPLAVVLDITRAAGALRGDDAWAGAIACARDERAGASPHERAERWSSHASGLRGRLEALGQGRALTTLEDLARAPETVGLATLAALDARLGTPPRRAQARPRLERRGWEDEVAWYVAHVGASEVLATGPRSAKAAGTERGEWAGRYARIGCERGVRTGEGRARGGPTSTRWALAEAMRRAMETIVTGERG